MPGTNDHDNYDSLLELIREETVGPDAHKIEKLQQKLKALLGDLTRDLNGIPLKDGVVIDRLVQLFFEKNIDFIGQSIVNSSLQIPTDHVGWLGGTVLGQNPEAAFNLQIYLRNGKITAYLKSVPLGGNRR